MTELLGITAWSIALSLVVSVSLLCSEFRYVLLVAFALRTVAACVHYWIAPLPFGSADAVQFETAAWQFAQGGLFETLGQFDPTGDYVYSWVASLVYSVVGRSPLMLQAINVLGGTLIVFNVCRIAKRLWGSSRARTLGWFVALFPFLILISAVTHREVAIVYFLTLGALFLVRWGQSDRLFDLGLAFVFLFVSALFHGGVAVALVTVGFFVLASAAKVLLTRILQGWIRIPEFITTVLGATILGVVVVAGAPQLSRVGDFTRVSDDVIARMAQYRARGDAVYLENVQPTSGADVVIQAPLRVVYFLFSPLPWDVRKVRHLVGLFDASLYALVLMGIWRSRNRIKDNRGAVILVFGIVMAIVAFSLVTSNFGTAMRHRAKFIPLLTALWGTAVIQRRLVLVKGTDLDNG